MENLLKELHWWGKLVISADFFGAELNYILR